MLGGSTHLNKRGSYFEGDLSGIQAARLPFWFQHFYKPGKKIAKTRNWDAKLDEIAEKSVGMGYRYYCGRTCLDTDPDGKNHQTSSVKTYP